MQGPHAPNMGYLFSEHDTHATSTEFFPFLTKFSFPNKKKFVPTVRPYFFLAAKNRKHKIYAGLIMQFRRGGGTESRKV